MHSTCHLLWILSWWFVLTQQDYSTSCGSCWDCEASCCFSASLLSIRTSNKQAWLNCPQKITDCCCACHFYLRKKSLHFSPTLCNTLDFLSSCLSVFLCLFLTVWQCDSGGETSSVLWGDVSRSEMSVLAPLIALCVGVCPCLCEFDACVWIR